MSILLYLIIISFNIISKNIPYFNFFDEGISFLSLGYFLFTIIQKKGVVKINKNEKICYIYIFIILIFGILGNIFFSYIVSNIVIFKDIIGTFKFFILYLTGASLVKQTNIHINPKKIIKVTKLIILIIFIFACINLFIDIGMSDSSRYGIKCYKFIYSHYTYLVYNEIIMYSFLLLDNKKNIIFRIMSILSMAATLRTKAFISIFFIFIIFIFENFKKKSFSIKNFFKIHYIIFMIITTYLLSINKIKLYLSWGMEQSIRVGLHIVGVMIANDHFPLGTGFGTFGTNLSYKNRSLVYDIYNTLNYSSLLKDGYATMSDVYWPSIYVQFGYIGLIFFILLLLYTFKDLFIFMIKDNRCMISAILIIFYMLSASISEATFSNESGSFSAVILIIIIMISKYKSKKITLWRENKDDE